MPLKVSHFPHSGGAAGGLLLDSALSVVLIQGLAQIAVLGWVEGL